MRADLTKVSKFLSLVLRHQPSAIGITLDPEGWADVQDLISAANARGQAISVDIVRQIVETNDKKRFALSEDGLRIRAVQGHSVAVDLQLFPRVPPTELFHGTATRFLDSIRARGLISGSRQHVHLSADRETAQRVGTRHGKPVVLTVAADAMHAAGHAFYLSDNNVWLTDAVPVDFIVFPG